MKMFWQRFNQEIIILITEPFLPEIRREALIMEAGDGSRMGSAGGTETQTAGAMLTDAYTPDGNYVNADGIWVS